MDETVSQNVPTLRKLGQNSDLQQQMQYGQSPTMPILQPYLVRDG